MKEAGKLDEQGRYYKKIGDIKKSEEMMNKAQALRKKYYIHDTEDNYLELYEKLNSNGINFIITQYPTLSINPLKDIFKDDTKIIFIENVDNFNHAFLNSSFTDYFVDNFGGTFGHTTKKGNQLIAENLASAILEKVDKI